MKAEENAKPLAVRSPRTLKTAEDFLRWRREQVALQEQAEEQHTQAASQQIQD
ncbi:MAG: hypothetical protein R6X34_20925 [Chloroflexota bacterium]